MIVDGLGGWPPGEVMGYAAAVCAAVILVRFVWNFAMTARSGRSTDDRRSARGARVAGPGDRQLVRDARRGLAGGRAGAAFTHQRGRAPAGRDLIQFITFSLILVTVVGQGLTLPWLIRRLGVIEEGTEEEGEETAGPAGDRAGRARACR